jgi:hypothetical protein
VPTPYDVDRVPTIVKTIKGSGRIAVNVPFVHAVVRLPTSQGYIMGVWLTVQRLTGASAETPSILVFPFIRPGVDFEYQIPQDAVRLPEPELTSQAQMMTNEAFDSLETFPYLEIPTPRNWNLTCEDLARIWSSRFDELGNPILIPYRQVWSDTAKTGLYDAITSLFLFQSGDLTVKTSWDATTTAQAGYSNWTPTGDTHYVDNPTDGKNYSDGSFKPVATVQVPFCDMRPVFRNVLNWQPEEPAFQPTFYTDSEGGDDFTNFWVKAGDNYQYFFLLPTPYYAHWPWVWQRDSSARTFPNRRYNLKRKATNKIR